VILPLTSASVFTSQHQKLQEREQRQDQLAVDKLVAGRMDLFIDELVLKKKEPDWKAIQRFAAIILHRCETKGLRGLERVDYLKFPVSSVKQLHEPFALAEKRILGESVSAKAAITGCLIVCAGPVQSESHLMSSIILATGKVTIQSHVLNSIIVCGNDVDIASHVKNSVVLARGIVKVGSFVRSSAVESGKERPLGRFGFFCPSQLGIDVEAVKMGLRVRRLDANKVLGRAGLEAGDVILQIDKTRVATPEAFRDALRGRLLNGEATLLVDRKGNMDHPTRAYFV